MMRASLGGLVVASALALLTPFGAHAQPDEGTKSLLVVGTPIDGNAAVATRVAESLRTALRDAGAPLGSQVRLGQLLAEAGGIERCKLDCLRRLAEQVPETLLVVLTSQGGGWTAARVEQVGTRERVLASFLSPDEQVSRAAQSMAGKLLSRPGSLRIEGGEAGSEVFIDGRSVGMVPIEGDIDLEAGDHVLRVGDGEGTGAIGRVHVLPLITETVNLDEWSGRRVGTVARKPLYARPWVWVLGAAIVGGSSFAATRGFGTLVPETTTVIVEKP